MKAIWLVRGRELASRLRFWTAIVGYDPRDRSVGQSIYLVYVIIFFAIWGFAVLAFLADLGESLLVFINPALPAQTAVLLISLVMMAEFFIWGYRAARWSPYLFSDADAELICQSPVNRGLLALAWFVGDWIPGGVLIAAGAVVLRFALLQLPTAAPIAWQNLPYYIFIGFLTTLVVLPIHLMLVAFVYSLGSLRLLKERDINWLPWAVIILALGFISLIITSQAGLRFILWPISFPLQAAFGEHSWIVGFAVSIVLATIGISCLYLASLNLNLSRASQESRIRFALRQAGRSGDSRLSQSIKTRQRLGIAHPASRLPGRAGPGSLIWKDWVTASRTVNLAGIASWIALFGLVLGLFLVADWGSRLWIYVIFCWLVSQRCTARLQADLGVWSVTRQLPFSASEFIFNEIVSPCVAAVMLAWLAIGVSTLLGGSLLIPGVILAPILILIITITTAWDIFRQNHSSQLLLGNVASPGLLGLVLAILGTGIPMGMLAWMFARIQLPAIQLLSAFFTGLVGLGIASLLWNLAKSTYRRIS